jgi:acid phosphatase (class A)
MGTSGKDRVYFARANRCLWVRPYGFGRTFAINGSNSMSIPQMKSFYSALLAGAIATAFTGMTDAALARYLDPSQVDLVGILAPPPAPKSPEGQAELEAVLAAQRTRTDADVKRAQADDELSVFRYADVMGEGFSPQNLPFATAFFKDVAADGGQVVNPTRAHFNRERPVVVDQRIEPVVKAGGGSYPSGTAAFAYEAAILLADMVPEKAPAIFARAADWGHNRVVSGVHYPGDVEAARISGSVIDNVLLHDAAFMADFAKAKAEVRRAIGLP